MSHSSRLPFRSLSLIVAAALAACFKPVFEGNSSQLDQEVTTLADAGDSDAGTGSANALLGATGNCGGVGTLHPYDSTAQLQALLVGRWVYCSGTTGLSSFGPNWSEQGAGLEIDSVAFVDQSGNLHGPGSFSVLIQLDGGALVPVTGFNSGGIANVGQEGPDSWQVNFWWNGGGGTGGIASFTDNPAQMQIAAGQDAVFALLP
jgi:hypothetical protein